MRYDNAALRKMKKLFKLIFSRFTLILLAILLQLSLYVFLPLFLQAAFPFAKLNIAFTILSVIIVLLIINSDMTIEGQLPLVILCITLPVVGIAFCTLFLRIKVPKKVKTTARKISEKTKPITSYGDVVPKQIADNSKGVFKYVYNVSQMRTYIGDGAEFLESGERFFVELKKTLLSAKKFIFMEYFIIDRGAVWSEIQDILARKASEGVEVRLMYDDLGTIALLPSSFSKQMKALNINCIKFNEYNRLASALYNNRDHRKITVVDGEIGFVGGANIADEYANLISPYGYWKDSAVKITGHAVNNLTCMFLQLYDIQSCIVDDPKKYCLATNDSDLSDNVTSLVCPFGDGPKYVYGDHVAETVYLNIINLAVKTLYVTTPYLIIDSKLKSALMNAASRGVDVRIITPGVPDKKAVYVITRSHYKELASAGVKIYELPGSFVHAKQIIADDELACVGTINLDYRSMLHHYECGVLLYKTSCVSKIKEDFQNSFSICEQKKDFKQNFLVRIFAALIKLFTPLF